MKWFRCETDMEVVRAELHEMEADFHNIQTDKTRVFVEDGQKPLLNFLFFSIDRSS